MVKLQNRVFFLFVFIGLQCFFLPFPAAIVWNFLKFMFSNFFPN